jgi:hypothetical protein
MKHQLFSYAILILSLSTCNAAHLIGATSFMIAPCTNKLVEINSAANLTVLNETFDTCPWHVNSATLDKHEGLFYVLRRHGVDASPLYITKYYAKNGKELSHKVLSDPTVNSLNAVWFDHDFQKIVCILLNETTAHWTTTLIDPDTGIIEEALDLHKLSNIGAFDMAFSGYDEEKKILYQVVGTHNSDLTLLSINVKDPSKSAVTYLTNKQGFGGNFLMAPTFHNGNLIGFLTNLTIAKFE